MPQQLDWKAEYAYTAGMQAFIYGFPYIYNAKLRHDWVTQARNPAVVPYAAVNHFWHAARVMVRDLADVPAPSRGHPGQMGMPGHHPGHLTTRGAPAAPARLRR